MARQLSSNAEIESFMNLLEKDLIPKILLDEVENINEFSKLFIHSNINLASALIPLEQATRPPKILIDSDITSSGIPWRLLQCPGGPIVLQIIAKKSCFALWVQEC